MPPPSQSDRSRWLKVYRQPAIAAVAKANSGARWSARLLRVLFEELHIDHDVTRAMEGLPLPAQSAQAVIVALAIRHSWRSDDFRRLLRRLDVKRSGLATTQAKRRSPTARR